MLVCCLIQSTKFSYNHSYKNSGNCFSNIFLLFIIFSFFPPVFPLLSSNTFLTFIIMIQVEKVSIGSASGILRDLNYISKVGMNDPYTQKIDMNLLSFIIQYIISRDELTFVSFGGCCCVRKGTLCFLCALHSISLLFS